ncbi:MAG: hemolysin D [Mariniblastus sp.]|nr:hemolysin D [Mariniblastus sp.]
MSIIPPPKPGGPTAPPRGSVVQMKIRPDLTFDRMAYQGVEYWVVKEPLGQKYYQFPPHVFYLLRELDGQKTIDQLQDGYHEKFAPKRITRQDLQQLLTRFHQDGLVTSNMPGQGKELLKRGHKNLMMERVGTFSNILAIRYKGFDPERILNFLLPYTWWLFTKAAAILVLLAAATALFSVLINWVSFQSKLPGFEAFFDPNQWYMFALVLCVTKIAHEFGHGLSCKRLGGECHEIGFMLLVLTPCLYCNVSDSWRLPNKWHRAAIGAAGMYIEVILATIATFVWWFVQPGFIQDIALKVMLVSSISTILFNGNPLLRFDGYYILSDILEIPNLNQKSTKALTTLLGRNWLGLDIPDDQLMPTNRPWAFAMFTVAAFCYRWFIMFSIIFFLMKMLEPYNLESIGIGIALFSMIGILVMPGYKLYKYMSVPGRMHEVKKVRFFVVLASALVILAMVLFIPIPLYLKCNAVVMPAEIETIWVNEPGTLESCSVEPGDQVVAGQTLAQLSNLDLQIQLLDSKKKFEEAANQYERAAMLQRQGKAQPIQSLLTEMAKAKNTLEKFQEQSDKLTLKSSISGTVVETPFEHTGTGSEELAEIDTLPLLYDQHKNVSAQRGQRFCEVADLSKWYAVIILTEDQVKFVKLEQPVKIKLYSEPGKLYRSKIDSIPIETDYSIIRKEYEPTQSSMQAMQSRAPDPLVEMVPTYEQANLQYVTRIQLDKTEVPPKIGMGAKAKIFVGNRSLGYRLWWWINQNFR